MVAFLLGCSFSFEAALEAAGKLEQTQWPKLPLHAVLSLVKRLSHDG